jgi:hypothetical protein
MSVAREQLTTSLFLVEELDDVSRTKELAESDVDALRAVADWIKTFRGQASQGSRPPLTCSPPALSG